jgi:DNA-binding transcriptional LysR family regulator
MDTSHPAIAFDPRLEIRHLRYFVAVAENLHFGRAAKALHISQPPLSRQVRDLETWIGVTLLDRSAKSIALTEAGAIFLQEARKILTNIPHSIHMAQRAAAGEMGSLAIAFDRFFDAALLDAIRADFAREHPGVRLTMHRVDSEEQSPLIRGGSLDGGFLLLPVSDGDRLTREPLFRETAVAVTAPGHSLKSRSGVTVRELAQFPFLEFCHHLNEPDYGHAGRIGTMCGVPLSVEGACSSFERLPQMLRESGSVALLPAGAAALYGETVHCLPVNDPGADFTFGLIYDRSRMPRPLTRFIESARELARRWNRNPSRNPPAEMVAA